MKQKIPQDMLEALLKAAEKKVNAHGWDKEPRLTTIELIERDGVPLALGLVPVPVEIQNPPGEFLVHLADGMIKNDELTQDLLDATPGFYGFAFICENWMNKMNPWERNGRMLADIPGSVEIRSISAVDLYGRCLTVVRERGKSPEIWRAGENVKLGGRVLTALLSMTKALTLQMPDNQPYRDAQQATIKAFLEYSDQVNEQAREARKVEQN